MKLDVNLFAVDEYVYALRNKAISLGLVNASALGYGDTGSILTTLLHLSAQNIAGWFSLAVGTYMLEIVQRLMAVVNTCELIILYLRICDSKLTCRWRPWWPLDRRAAAQNPGLAKKKKKNSSASRHPPSWVGEAQNVKRTRRAATPHIAASDSAVSTHWRLREKDLMGLMANRIGCGQQVEVYGYAALPAKIYCRSPTQAAGCGAVGFATPAPPS